MENEILCVFQDRLDPPDSVLIKNYICAAVEFEFSPKNLHRQKEIRSKIENDNTHEISFSSSSNTSASTNTKSYHQQKQQQPQTQPQPQQQQNHLQQEEKTPGQFTGT